MRSDRVLLLSPVLPWVKGTDAESPMDGRLRAREKDWDTVAPTVARTMPAAACHQSTWVCKTEDCCLQMCGLKKHDPFP